MAYTAGSPLQHPHCSPFTAGLKLDTTILLFEAIEHRGPMRFSIPGWLLTAYLNKLDHCPDCLWN